MHMLLDFEGTTLLFQLQREHDVQVLCLSSRLLIVFTIDIELRSIRILHIVACMTTVEVEVHTLVDERLCQFLHQIVLSLEVYHRTCFSTFIDHEQRGNASILGHLRVISTEGRSDMYNTSTIVDGYIVARDDAESQLAHLYELVVTHCEALISMLFRILLHKVSTVNFHLLARLHPRHQLFEAHADKVGTLIIAHNAVRYHLITLLVFLHRGKLAFGLQV